MFVELDLHILSGQSQGQVIDAGSAIEVRVVPDGEPHAGGPLSPRSLPIPISALQFESQAHGQVVSRQESAIELERSMDLAEAEQRF
ncbi:MAG: hypothetical protein IPF57_17740 [Gammaproteobacteria bacterium]|nr:hypothetical protein [Gammaproteobacteria bacterium]